MENNPRGSFYRPGRRPARIARALAGGAGKTGGGGKPERSGQGAGKAFFRWLTSPNLRLLKIDKYVFSEVWGWWLLALMGFTFFMLVTSLFLLGEKIFSKKIPIYTTIKILILSAPAYIVLALPIAMLVGTLMAMGRLSRDNEITMFVASGVSLYSIFLPFLCLGLYTAILAWSVYEYVVPANNKQFTKVLAVFWDSQVIDYIKPNVVIKAPEDKYFYIERVDRVADVMYNVRLFDFAKKAKTPRVFLAEKATVKNKFLNLENVRVIETDEKTGNVIASATASRTEVDIERKFSMMEYDTAPQELSSKELIERVKTKQREMAEDLKRFQFVAKDRQESLWMDQTEYYLKFAIPFASVVFVLVAVPMSLRGPRDERNLGLVLAFVLALIYYALFFSFRMLGYLGKLPAVYAAWTPTLLFAIAGLILLVRARK
ncbi:MAG: YjgP/YjgQ family permease [bacterium]